MIACDICNSRGADEEIERVEVGTTKVDVCVYCIEAMSYGCEKVMKEHMKQDATDEHRFAWLSLSMRVHIINGLKRDLRKEKKRMKEDGVSIDSEEDEVES